MSDDTNRGLDSDAGRLPGILMLAGIAIFLVTVFSPTVLFDFFDADDVEAQAAVIEGARTEWTIVWLVLVVGTMLLGFGLWRFARELRNQATDEQTRSIARGAGFLALAAQAGYALVGIFNIVASPTSAAEGPAGGDVPFWAYVLVLLVSLAGFAFILMRIKQRRWMAILLAVIVVLHFLQLVLTGDIIPLSIYLLLAPIAIALTARPLGQHRVGMAAAPA